MTIIEIKPFRNGWQVQEAPRVIAPFKACCYTANLFPHLTFCILTGEASCEQNLVSYSPTPDPAGPPCWEVCADIF
jgi:hypothetical protein